MANVTRCAATKLVVGASPIIAAPVSSHVASKALTFKESPVEFKTVDSLQASVNKAARGGLLTTGLAVKGINVSSRRFAHTDVKFPDMSNYRRDSTLDATKPARETEDARRALPHAAYYGAGGVLALWAAKETVQTLVYYKAMAADQRALASIEISMNDVPEGTTKTFEWRGKPVFVKHRTKTEIAREKAVPVGDLRHPQHDDERVQRDEWSVVIGVCTHLGCVPIANAGDFGGYYCPCHGSHYDASGRIRKGPAPLNLHVPAYSFKESTIVIGQD